jgi:hypothetical protein
MKKLSDLLFGEHKDGRSIFIILLSSIAFSGYILWIFPLTLKTALTAILALDIFAGLMSNLQPQTNQAWKKQSRISRILFVTFHLTIYPLLIVLFQVSLPLMTVMLVLLLTKTSAFVVGTKK